MQWVACIRVISNQLGIFLFLFRDVAFDPGMGVPRVFRNERVPPAPAAPVLHVKSAITTINIMHHYTKSLWRFATAVQYTRCSAMSYDGGSVVAVSALTVALTVCVVLSAGLQLSVFLAEGD
jgi:hypothetical protein